MNSSLPIWKSFINFLLKEVDDKKKKWEKVGQIIDDTLKLLEPYQYILIDIDISQSVQVMKEHDNLTAVIAKMITSVDWIKAYVTPEEYTLIEPFVNQLMQLIDKETGLCNEFCELCMKSIDMQMFRNGKIASEETVSNKQKEILERIKQVKKGFFDLQRRNIKHF